MLFGTVDTFLIWRLTGGRCHVTDVSNASRTLLFNIHTLDWDDELLGLLDVPRAMLPEVRGVERGLRRDAIRICSARAVPIAGRRRRSAGGALRAGVLRAGHGEEHLRHRLLHAAQHRRQPVPSQKGLLTTIGWQIGGEIDLCARRVGVRRRRGGAVAARRAGAIEASADVEQLMTEVPDTDGVYLVPAFVGLGAPYWDPRARGVIVGLTRNTKMAHIARAAVDAMAYQTRDVLEVMQEEPDLPLHDTRRWTAAPRPTRCCCSSRPTC